MQFLMMFKVIMCRFIQCILKRPYTRHRLGYENVKPRYKMTKSFIHKNIKGGTKW